MIKDKYILILDSVIQLKCINANLCASGFTISQDFSGLTMGWDLTGLGIALIIIIVAGATFVLCKR